MVATKRNLALCPRWNERHTGPRNKINRESERRRKCWKTREREAKRRVETRSKRLCHELPCFSPCTLRTRCEHVHAMHCAAFEVESGSATKVPSLFAPCPFLLAFSLSPSLFVRVPRARPTCKSCGDIWFTYVIRVAVPWVFPSPTMFQPPLKLGHPLPVQLLPPPPVVAQEIAPID